MYFIIILSSRTYTIQLVAQIFTLKLPQSTDVVYHPVTVHSSTVTEYTKYIKLLNY